MKRFGNLYDNVANAENIEIADNKARKCKKKNWGIKKHDRHRELDNQELLKQLLALDYKTSAYSTFKVYEPKERIIFRLPYYPDRITHHAIMNIMETLWVNIFIAHTYSCIKNRGIHKLCTDIKRALRSDPLGTEYCLKLDIKKFYPSIDHEVLKEIVRKKIKDKRLLILLDEIIDSTDGVPIGNYLSQFFANLVLTYFDHWILEEVATEFAKDGHRLHYFRYADDIVFLSDSKDVLRKVLILTKTYLHHVVKLEIKQNYQIFPVYSRGIDFVGYKFYHSHTLLRKNIKNRMFRLISKYKRSKISQEELLKRIQSYFGWLKHCDSKNLLQKVERETGLHFSNWEGEDTIISRFYGKNIHVVEVVSHKKYFKIHFMYRGRPFSVNSASKVLFRDLTANRKFPFNYLLVNKNKRL